MPHKMRPYTHAQTNWKAVKYTDCEPDVLLSAATGLHNYHLHYPTDIIEGEALATEADRFTRETNAINPADF